VTDPFWTGRKVVKNESRTQMSDLKSERVRTLNNSNPAMGLRIAAILCALSPLLLGSSDASAQATAPDTSSQKWADCRNKAVSENVPKHQRRRYLRRCMADTGAGAEHGTVEQRMACMGDAFRFCFSEIPNIPRITTCMKANFRQLSPACQAQFK
jgi:hypothetical protein